LIALGVLCAFGGAVVFGAVHLRLDNRPAEIAIAQGVVAGSVIHSSDLSVVRVSSDPGLDPIPASQASSVAGRVARVDLAPGTLLTSSEVGSAPLLAPGQVVVAVSLKGSQLPAALTPGEHVAVINTGGSSQSGAAAGPVSVLVPDAAVFAVPSGPDSSGASQVSLTVDARSAPQIAGAAAAGQVSLVLLPPSP
jgi:hypothetical protein